MFSVRAWPGVPEGQDRSFLSSFNSFESPGMVFDKSYCNIVSCVLWDSQPREEK